MKGILKFFLLSSFIMLMSCGQEPSLQKYFVQHQEDEGFMHLDVSTNMLFNNLNNIPEEDREKLRAFRKINVLALPINGKNDKQYQKEKEKVLSIFQQGKYKLLIKMKYSQANFQLYYLGQPENIEEIIIMAYSDEKGFTIARVLGNQLSADVLVETINSAKYGDLEMNFDAFKDVFDNID